MKLLWRLCISLELCLVLLALLCGAMGTGSFRLSGEYAAAINAMPLLSWLREAPAGVSWWLWLTVALLALLVVNTLLCSFATLATRWGRLGFMPLFAPQMMHAGFLLIVAAHLLSASGSFSEQMVVVEGSLVRLPDGKPFTVSGIRVDMSPLGMPVGYSNDLVTGPDTPSPGRVTISPNHPWLSGGFGVYIKQAEAYPYRRALLEVHHEPGAGMALAGALLFTAGNLLVLSLRARNRESVAPEAAT